MRVEGGGSRGAKGDPGWDCIFGVGPSHLLALMVPWRQLVQVCLLEAPGVS